MILGITYLFSVRGAGVAKREEPTGRNARRHIAHVITTERLSVTLNLNPKPVLTLTLKPSLNFVGPCQKLSSL